MEVPGNSEGELRALQHDTQRIIDGGSTRYEDVANPTDYRTAPDPDTGEDVFNRVQFGPVATGEVPLATTAGSSSPIRCSRCSAGQPRSTCTSRPRVHPGSTRSNGGSPRLPDSPARHAPQHRGAGTGDRGVLERPQRAPKAVHLDQERRPDPRITQDLLRTNF